MQAPDAAELRPSRELRPVLTSSPEEKRSELLPNEKLRLRSSLPRRLEHPCIPLPYLLKGHAITTHFPSCKSQKTTSADQTATRKGSATKDAEKEMAGDERDC